MVKKSYPITFSQSTDCFPNGKNNPFKNLVHSLTSNKTSLLSRLISISKNGSEDVLYLVNPLTVTSQLRNQSTLFSSLHPDTHNGLLNLNLKPSLKIDKKVKKNEKDDERDVDRVNPKTKVKKKSRSKLNFDEDYESVNELFETPDVSEDISLLSLARPPKPVNVDVPGSSFTIKQKNQNPSPTKKKKSIGSSSKKDLPNANIDKPNTLTLKQPVTVQELSDLFVVSKTDIIRSLFMKGIPVTVNQILDLTTVQKLGEEFGVEVKLDLSEEQNNYKRIELVEETSDRLISRPPIVTIMGHVDHGKTTLLDKIRKTQTAQKEAGGITQKIGAYEVVINYKGDNKKIVFLDTPGHAAFSGMRSRGVSITDIVILVVAADDGVKPQTVEAIKYAQSAKVPLIIAINKIDKDDANVDSIKEELTQYNLIPEDWGGDTLMVPISAMQETNLDNLLEMVILLSEMMNLKCNPNSLAEGTILESHLDRTRGAVASLIVQNGRLQIGDILNVSNTVSKVRGMMNCFGESIRYADPSSPVFIWGLPRVPSVGDHFSVFKDEKDAKLFVNSGNLVSKSGVYPVQQLSDNYTVSDSETKEKINLIIKTDTQGSSEAINSSLSKINDSKVQIRILYSCAGEITETDVEFASTSNATLLAFNTTSASGAKKAAKNMSINIKEFNVIYDLFDYVQVLIENLVGPQYDEKFIGLATVKTVFPLAKSFVAGISVTEGKIIKAAFVHVIRGDEVVYKGSINSLKRLKEDALEVSEGSECGIFLSSFDSWKQGDVIKAFELIPKKKI